MLNEFQGVQHLEGISEAKTESHDVTKGLYELQATTFIGAGKRELKGVRSISSE